MLEDSRNDAAAKETKRNAARHKEYYDRLVRYAKLGPADRVIVRNLGIRGKQKLADMWEHSLYLVKRQSMQGIPVSGVYKETSQNPKIRLLHRNMFLHLLGLSCHEVCETEEVGATSRNTEKAPLLSTSDSSTDDSLSSDNASGTEEPTDEADAMSRRRRPEQVAIYPRRFSTQDLQINDAGKIVPRLGNRARRPPERFQAGQALFENTHLQCQSIR